ncbi:MAG TPA: hypothetical protein VF529_08490 [Solirubrobacteraceae bacterium]
MAYLTPELDEFDLDVRFPRSPAITAVTPHTECDAAECVPANTVDDFTCAGTCPGGGNTCDGTCPGEQTCETCAGNTCEGTCVGNTCEGTCEGDTCPAPCAPPQLTDEC